MWQENRPSPPLRREAANSNERRRMQNINAGFQAIRNLLPPIHEPEKLSKAGVLVEAAAYISQLQQDKNKLLLENLELKRLLSSEEGSTIETTVEGATATNQAQSSPSPAAALDTKPSIAKRRKTKTLVDDGSSRVESAKEETGNPLPNHDGQVSASELKEQDMRKRETLELGLQMEKKRRDSQQDMLKRYAQTQQQQQMQQESTIIRLTYHQDPDVQTVERGESRHRIMPLTLPIRNVLDVTPNCYTQSLSARSNLDSIVEAIRRVEGDHVFSSSPMVASQNSQCPDASPVPTLITQSSSSSFPRGELNSSFVPKTNTPLPVSAAAAAAARKQNRVVNPDQTSTEPANMELRPRPRRSISPPGIGTQPGIQQYILPHPLHSYQGGQK